MATKDTRTLEGKLSPERRKRIAEKVRKANAEMARKSAADAPKRAD
jgi:hypothetical protein